MWDNIYLFSILGILLAVVLFGIPIYWLMKFHDRCKSSMVRSLELIYSCFEFSKELKEGYIEVDFYTYFGFIGYTEQRRHNVFVRIDQAEVFLRKLHRTNFKYGLFGHGALYVPFLSWITLVQQIRKIRKQLNNRIAY